jgi:hypothetical protein
VRQRSANSRSQIFYALQDIGAATIEAASVFDERFIFGSNKSHKQSAM